MKKFIRYALGIIINPASTFHIILEEKPLGFVILVVIIAVILGNIPWGAMPVGLAVGFTIIPLVWWIFGSAIFLLVGRCLFHGKGSFKDMLLVTGWSNVIGIITFFWDNLSSIGWILSISAMIWQTIVEIVGVWIAHKFSRTKAVATALLPTILFWVLFLRYRALIWNIVTLPSLIFNLGIMDNPGIVYIKGSYIISANAYASSPRIAFPIPLDFEDQVPIYLEVRTKPANALQDWKIKERGFYNWLVELELKPIRKGRRINLDWKSYVLIRRGDRKMSVSENSISSVEEFPEEVKRWLSATVSVQSNNTRIVEKAKEIRGDSGDMREIIKKTAFFVKTIKRDQYKTLDAVEALGKGGSCTSYANLNAALFRANGIPTRILAVYPTNSVPLQTHYIVEFFVPGQGWMWIEPQTGNISWEPYKAVVVDVVYPEDEDKSFEQHRWAGKGVPWMSVTEQLSNDSISYMPNVLALIGCDHVAGEVKEFVSEDKQWEEAFGKTKEVWQYYLKCMKEGRGIPDDLLVLQRLAAESRNLPDYLRRIREAKKKYSELINVSTQEK